MERTTPLTRLHTEAEAEFAVFPPAGSVFADDMPPIEVVASFGDTEAEYIALTQGAGLLDLPHRSALTLTGEDRLDFLNQMLTQDLKGLAPGRCVRSFWLNRKGRIEADLRVIHLADRTLLWGDRADCLRAFETLSAFIITEDVELANEAQTHLFALIGPNAFEILRTAATQLDDSTSSDLAPGSVVELEIAGAAVVAAFDDSLGAPRCELSMSKDAATNVYQRLLETGFNLAGESSERFRAVGFEAFNTRRVEASAPMVRFDFGRASLPHETGVLSDRVSFTKGCYLGQEIVARLQSLGHPKQRLVVLQLDDKSALPALGDLLYPADEMTADSVGVVTSAAKSPKRNGAPTLLAQVRFDHSQVKTTLRTKTSDLAEIVNSFSIGE